MWKKNYIHEPLQMVYLSQCDPRLLNTHDFLWCFNEIANNAVFEDSNNTSTDAQMWCNLGWV